QTAQKVPKALKDMQNDVLTYLNAKQNLNENEREELDKMIKIISQKLLARKIDNMGFNDAFNY
ncbi:hypothetical protein M0O54_20155, partial [Acinetobacter lactucae]